MADTRFGVREGTDERFTIMEMFVPTTGKMPRWDQFRSCPDVTAYSILGFDIFPGSYAFVFEKYFYTRVILVSSIFLLNFREHIKSGREEINKERWNFLQFYLLKSLNFNIELKMLKSLPLNPREELERKKKEFL